MKKPITKLKSRTEAPPTRLREAQALWAGYNKWLLSHPSPRWVFRGQSRNWALKPSIGRIERYRPATELQLLNMFKRSALPMVAKSAIASNWDWLAVAQHHGLPTRLIDWTTNSLAAIFFATGEGAGTKSDGVIIATEPRSHRFYRAEDPDEADPFDISEAGFFILRPLRQELRHSAAFSVFTRYRLVPGRSVPKKTGLLCPGT